MSITLAKGFKAAGIAAGIKENGKKDLAIVVNQGPNFAAAGVFTKNRFAAAPVQWTKQAIANGQLRAVVLNSGGANACTGAAGYADTVATAEKLAETLSHDEALDVAVCSTGLIGEPLPLPKILVGIEKAELSDTAAAGTAAAQAIMTTDTVAKEAGHTSRHGWHIGGMAKGAGMLAPALATMLVVITTDANLTGAELKELLPQATNKTFDRADSDGCMSTNDTVLLLSSGAGPKPDKAEFLAALTSVCADLAKQLIADAEGASHDISISVTSAASEADALEVGRAVARSNLFKCAIFGQDPNWGRVLSAVGTTAATFDPNQVEVKFNGISVFKNGGINQDRKLVKMTDREVLVEIDLGSGSDTATIITNDLTYGYVKENAEYSS